MTLLEIEHLGVTLPGPGGDARVLDDVSLTVDDGEIVGLVGESGSGKSMTALAVLGLLPDRGARVEGAIRFRGRELVGAPESTRRALRGAEIGMVFQEAGESLHPHFRIGRQVGEAILAHRRASRDEVRRQVVDLLDSVHLPDPPERARQYPFELSGGMQQRVMLATALACRPPLLIADEPTTALDVTIQAQIIDLLLQRQRELGSAVLFITHDLALLAGFADRVVVMRAGRIVESGSTAEVLAAPQHPYTRALVDAAPRLRPEAVGRSGPRRAGPRRPAGPDGESRLVPDKPRLPPRESRTAADEPPLPPHEELATTDDPLRPPHKHPAATPEPLLHPDKQPARTDGAPPRESPAATHEPLRPPREDLAATHEPLLAVTGLRRQFVRRRTAVLRRGLPPAVAVDGVDLEVRPGETVAIVGESGSGKSTLARLVLRLLAADDGSIRFLGDDITRATGRSLQRVRSSLQAVLQDPTASLDPTMTAGEHVGIPLRVHRRADGPTRRRRIAELFDLVGLAPEHAHRYPYELSGGQRQRVALARALAAEPRLVVLDEPLSSLDVSTQSQVVTLLERLQRELGVAFVLIAHDLPIVRRLAHRVYVMYLGRIVESGPTARVFDAPRHPYTQALLSAVPTLDAGERPSGRIRFRGEIPSPTAVPSGCRFRTRCPFAFDACESTPPATLSFDGGGTVECHLHDRGPHLAGRSVDVLAPGKNGHDPSSPAPTGPTVPSH